MIFTSACTWKGWPRPFSVIYICFGNGGDASFNVTSFCWESLLLLFLFRRQDSIDIADGVDKVVGTDRSSRHFCGDVHLGILEVCVLFKEVVLDALDRVDNALVLLPVIHCLGHSSKFILHHFQLSFHVLTLQKEGSSKNRYGISYQIESRPAQKI